ncbi:MAG: ABC transporter permease [Bacillota bacterium]|nr:ABC transporter permease [Bacillota bacterium]
MSFLFNTAWALRHCRKRLFESILIVFVIGLGVAVIVSILTVILLVQSQMQSVYNYEWIRTFRVYSAASFSRTTGQEPILSIVQERPQEPLQVSLSELKDLERSLPTGMYVFAEQTMSFPSRLLPKPAEEADETLGSYYETIGPASMSSQGTTRVITTRSMAVSEESIVIVEVQPDVDGTEPLDAEAEAVETEQQEADALVQLKSMTLDQYITMREQYEYINMVGTTISYFDFKQYRIAKGNLFVEADIANGSRVMVLSDQLANRIFPDQDPIGQHIPIEIFGMEQNVLYTVIGVLAPFEENESFSISMAFGEYPAFVPITAMPSSWTAGADQETLLDNFVIGVEDGIDLAEASEIIQAEIRQRYGDLGIVDNSYLVLTEQNNSSYSLYIIIAIFASLGLVIAAINILNLMLARVLRRTKSIGLAMALGSAKSTVFGQFLLEAVILGLTGAVVGIGLSFALVKGIISKLILTEISFGITSIAAGCGLGLLVSLLFGVYPAYQGAAIDPVDALRTE